MNWVSIRNSIWQLWSITIWLFIVDKVLSISDSRSDWIANNKRCFDEETMKLVHSQTHVHCYDYYNEANDNKLSSIVDNVIFGSIMFIQWSLSHVFDIKIKWRGKINRNGNHFWTDVLSISKNPNSEMMFEWALFNHYHDNVHALRFIIQIVEILFIIQIVDSFNHLW